MPKSSQVTTFRPVNDDGKHFLTGIYKTIILSPSKQVSPSCCFSLTIPICQQLVSYETQCMLEPAQFSFSLYWLHLGFSEISNELPAQAYCKVAIVATDRSSRRIVATTFPRAISSAARATLTFRSILAPTLQQAALLDPRFLLRKPQMVARVNLLGTVAAPRAAALPTRPLPMMQCAL